MEPNKVKVSVIVRYVGDRQDKEIADANSDSYLVLQGIKRALNAVSLKNDDEDTESVYRILNAAKHSNEVMGSAFIDIDRDDLVDEKIQSNKVIDQIIDFIKSSK